MSDPIHIVCPQCDAVNRGEEVAHGLQIRNTSSHQEVLERFTGVRLERRIGARIIVDHVGHGKEELHSSGNCCTPDGRRGIRAREEPHVARLMGAQIDGSTRVRERNVRSRKRERPLPPFRR